MISILDGPTNGPNSYTGEYGTDIVKNSKNPEECLESGIIREPISGNIQDDVGSLENNNDVNYLHKIVKKVIEGGSLDEKFSLRTPGPINHARWLTAANGWCRLWFQQKEFTTNYMIILYFIIRIYAFMHFEIKLYPDYRNGLKHFHTIIQLGRSAFGDLVGIHHKTGKEINPFELLCGVMKKNSFWATYENACFCLLFEERLSIREMIVSEIKMIRKLKRTTVRKLKHKVLSV